MLSILLINIIKAAVRNNCLPAALFLFFNYLKPRKRAAAK